MAEPTKPTKPVLDVYAVFGFTANGFFSGYNAFPPGTPFKGIIDALKVPNMRFAVMLGAPQIDQTQS